MANQKYLYPVKRIGNESNPKFLILLSNPGGSAEFYKRLPKYVMDKDGLYSDAGMNLHLYREYCKWWDDVLYASDDHVKDTDVLALEYYPYHTVGSGDNLRQFISPNFINQNHNPMKFIANDGVIIIEKEFIFNRKIGSNKYTVGKRGLMSKTENNHLIVQAL